MRTSRIAILAAVLALLTVLPAQAVEAPVVMKNVDLVNTVPNVSPISAAIDEHRPYMYVSKLTGIDVFDISDPERPVLTGTVPIAMFENEAMSMGAAAHRRDGATFVLIGVDLTGGVTPTDPSGIDPVDSSKVYVVDVTDPAAPYIRSHVETNTRTHTVSCASDACDYAYTSGSDKTGFSIVDLTDLDNPKDIKTVPTVFAGHDWDRDAAGVMWSVGWNGTAAWDASDPVNPVLLNTTDEHGTASPYNDFIHHNSYRPNAGKFNGTPAGSNKEPSALKGEVLLVTEEDYDDPTCEGEGSFQTWHVNKLDGRAGDPMTPDQGTITPLDTWNTEIYSTGQKTRAGAFCSAHYFDVHQDGFVAQGWYQQGLRILDVRDPRNIKQVGYMVTQAQEVWIAYWVPERGADGRVLYDREGETVRTNLVYSLDSARGIDVVRVDLPTTSPADTTPVEAPILDRWLDRVGDWVDRGTRYGFACLLPSVTT